MMNLAKDMIMRIKPQDFKFDVLTVAGCLLYTSDAADE